MVRSAFQRVLVVLAALAVPAHVAPAASCSPRGEAGCTSCCCVARSSSGADGGRRCCERERSEPAACCSQWPDAPTGGLAHGERSADACPCWHGGLPVRPAASLLGAPNASLPRAAEPLAALDLLAFATTRPAPAPAARPPAIPLHVLLCRLTI